MKVLTKSAVWAVTVGLVAVSASATTYSLSTGELIIGFTTKSGTDLVYDLGTESSLVNGETWNLSSNLSGYNLSNLYWGIVGVTTSGGNKTWVTFDQSQNLSATSSVPATISTANLSSIYNNINAIYAAMPAAGAGNSYTVSTSSTLSWDYETIDGPSGANIYRNSYPESGGMNPNELGTGVAINFFQVLTTGATPTVVGSFELNSSGVLSFSTSPAPTPEPSTYGLLAAGLLAFPLRRFFRKA